jgi:hypothetical protein
MTSSRIEPATFRFVARYLNHLRDRVPRMETHLRFSVWRAKRLRLSRQVTVLAAIITKVYLLSSGLLEDTRLSATVLTVHYQMDVHPDSKLLQSISSLNRSAQRLFQHHLNLTLLPSARSLTSEASGPQSGVTRLFRDFPLNSHKHSEVILPISSYPVHV